MKKEKVLPGIDYFLKNRLYKSKRIGLITNQTGVTSKGIPTWKALLSKGYTLTALFGPEHGFRGEAQDAVSIEDSSFNGINTYSLYGKRLSPTEEMLKNVEVLLYDIQDIGCRYYTYLYTLAYSMEVCGKAETSLVVLDRPNPITHYQVEGNSISDEYSSFVGGYGLPNIYGLTIGEFAGYLKLYYYKDIKLDVIPMQNYRRNMPFEDTGLPWIFPSPNIPSLQTTSVYPGTCLFEGTNVSEGRGTTRPFEIIGAPWIDGEELRATLSRLSLPGVVFSSLFFTPVFSKYKNVSCGGISIHIEDRHIYKPLYTGLAILHTIRSLYPENFHWKRDWEKEDGYFVDKLTGSRDVRKMMDKNESIKRLYSELIFNTNDFLHRREAVLMYSET